MCLIENLEFASPNEKNYYYILPTKFTNLFTFRISLTFNIQERKKIVSEIIILMQNDISFMCGSPLLCEIRAGARIFGGSSEYFVTPGQCVFSVGTFDIS